MSDDWQKAVAKQWTARHEQTQKLAGELAALETPANAPPSAAKVWEKARKLVDLHGDAAAVATLEQVVSLEPKHAGANFVLGRHYLHTDDPRGVDFIETAIATDPALAQTGCNLLYAHFNRTGQRDKLRPLEHRFDDLQKLNVLAQKERAQIRAGDTFIPHELTAEQIAELRKIFSAETAIGSAAVARKQLEYFPTNPCFAIGLKIKVAWWKRRSQKENQKLVNRVLKQVRLPGYFLVFVGEKNLKGLATKIFDVPGAVVYEREK
jgi:hypothetical protein